MTDQTVGILCENCGASALNLDMGKCEKCGATAKLETYSYKIHKMRDGSYLLTKKDAVDPIDNIPTLSEVSKKNVVKLTGAPYEVVAASFAALKIKEEQNAEFDEKGKEAKKEPKVERKKLDPETEAKLEAALQEIIDAPNQLEALSKHLDNLNIGEDDTKKAVVVLNLSGKCKDELKQIILFKATEGAGKSTLMRVTTKGFKVKDVGRFSSHALDYTDLEGYEILSLKELGMMDEETQGVSTLKFLSSDDMGYTVEVTVRNEETGRFTTEQHKIPPITTISSTIRLQLDPQFERRAWLFGLDESKEQTARIVDWVAKNDHQKSEKILGKRRLTDEEFSSEVYSRFIQQFKPKEIIIPFPHAILNTLSFNVLRVRGDLGKLLTFTKLYAMLNLKRLEKVNEEIYTLTPEVTIETLKLSLQPIAGMLAKLDDRTKILFSALKEVQENEADSTLKFDKKGSEITKRVREQIAVKIGKSERTVRSFLAQLTASGYVSDDDRKPKTFTLLYDVDELEKKTAGLLEKTKSADVLMEEMRKEAQEWVKTSLENFSLADGQIITSTVSGNEGTRNNNSAPSTEEKISNTVLANSQTDSVKQGLDNWLNEKSPIIQGDTKREPYFCFERIKPSEKCDCGKHSVEYKITFMSGPLKGDVLPRCESCFQNLRLEFRNQVWHEKRGVEQYG